MSKGELLVPHRKCAPLSKISEKKLIGISQFEINNQDLAPVFFSPHFHLGTGSQYIQKEQLNSLDIMNLLQLGQTLWAIRWPNVGHSKHNQFPIVFLQETVSTQSSSPLLLGWIFIYLLLVVVLKSYSGTFPFLTNFHMEN